MFKDHVNSTRKRTKGNESPRSSSTKDVGRETQSTVCNTRSSAVDTRKEIACDSTILNKTRKTSDTSSDVGFSQTSSHDNVSTIETLPTVTGSNVLSIARKSRSNIRSAGISPSSGYSLADLKKLCEKELTVKLYRCPIVPKEIRKWSDGQEPSEILGNLPSPGTTSVSGKYDDALLPAPLSKKRTNEAGPLVSSISGKRPNSKWCIDKFLQELPKVGHNTGNSQLPRRKNSSVNRRSRQYTRKIDVDLISCTSEDSEVSRGLKIKAIRKCYGKLLKKDLPASPDIASNNQASNCSRKVKTPRRKSLPPEGESSFKTKTVDSLGSNDQSSSTEPCKAKNKTALKSSSSSKRQVSASSDVGLDSGSSSIIANSQLETSMYLAASLAIYRVVEGEDNFVSRAPKMTTVAKNSGKQPLVVMQTNDVGAEKKKRKQTKPSTIDGAQLRLTDSSEELTEQKKSSELLSLSEVSIKSVKVKERESDPSEPKKSKPGTTEVNSNTDVINESHVAVNLEPDAVVDSEARLEDITEQQNEVELNSEERDRERIPSSTQPVADSLHLSRVKLKERTRISQVDNISTQEAEVESSGEKSSVRSEPKEGRIGKRKRQLRKSSALSAAQLAQADSEVHQVKSSLSPSLSGVVLSTTPDDVEESNSTSEEPNKRRKRNSSTSEINYDGTVVTNVAMESDVSVPTKSDVVVASEAPAEGLTERQNAAENVEEVINRYSDLASSTQPVAERSHSSGVKSKDRARYSAVKRFPKQLKGLSKVETAFKNKWKQRSVTSLADEDEAGKKERQQSESLMPCADLLAQTNSVELMGQGQSTDSPSVSKVPMKSAELEESKSVPSEPMKRSSKTRTEEYSSEMTTCATTESHDTVKRESDMLKASEAKLVSELMDRNLGRSLEVPSSTQPDTAQFPPKKFLSKPKTVVKNSRKQATVSTLSRENITGKKKRHRKSSMLSAAQLGLTNVEGKDRETGSESLEVRLGPGEVKSVPFQASVTSETKEDGTEKEKGQLKKTSTLDASQLAQTDSVESMDLGKSSHSPSLSGIALKPDKVEECISTSQGSKRRKADSSEIKSDETVSDVIREVAVATESDAVTALKAPDEDPPEGQSITEEVRGIKRSIDFSRDMPCLKLASDFACDISRSSKSSAETERDCSTSSGSPAASFSAEEYEADNDAIELMISEEDKIPDHHNEKWDKSTVVPEIEPIRGSQVEGRAGNEKKTCTQSIQPESDVFDNSLSSLDPDCSKSPTRSSPGSVNCGSESSFLEEKRQNFMFHDTIANSSMSVLEEAPTQEIFKERDTTSRGEATSTSAIQPPVQESNRKEEFFETIINDALALLSSKIDTRDCNMALFDKVCPSYLFNGSCSNLEYCHLKHEIEVPFNNASSNLFDTFVYVLKYATSPPAEFFISLFHHYIGRPKEILALTPLNFKFKNINFERTMWEAAIFALVSSKFQRWQAIHCILRMACSCSEDYKMVNHLMILLGLTADSVTRIFHTVSFLLNQPFYKFPFNLLDHLVRDILDNSPKGFELFLPQLEFQLKMNEGNTAPSWRKLLEKKNSAQLDPGGRLSSDSHSQRIHAQKCRNDVLKQYFWKNWEELSRVISASYCEGTKLKEAALAILSDLCFAEDSQEILTEIFRFLNEKSRNSITEGENTDLSDFISRVALCLCFYYTGVGKWLAAYDTLILIVRHCGNPIKIRPFFYSLAEVEVALLVSKINFFNGHHERAISVFFDNNLLVAESSQWRTQGSPSHFEQIKGTVLTFLTKMTENPSISCAHALASKVIAAQKSVNEPIDVSPFLEQIFVNMFQIDGRNKTYSYNLYLMARNYGHALSDHVTIRMLVVQIAMISNYPRHVMDGLIGAGIEKGVYPPTSLDNVHIRSCMTGREIMAYLVYWMTSIKMQGTSIDNIKFDIVVEKSPSLKSRFELGELDTVDESVASAIRRACVVISSMTRDSSAKIQRNVIILSKTTRSLLFLSLRETV